MNDLSAILSVASAITVIGGSFTMIKKIVNPYQDLKSKVEKHENLLHKDNLRIIESEEANRVICKCMLALLEHEITGNSTEKLKTAKKQLQDYLIER